MTNCKEKQNSYLFWEFEMHIVQPEHDEERAGESAGYPGLDLIRVESTLELHFSVSR